MSAMMDFDPGSLRFGRHKGNVRRVLTGTLVYLLVVLVVTVLAYGLLSLVLNTDTERRLRSEIRMYERMYPELEPREEMLSDAIALLQHKDDRIYGQVFHSTAPAADPMAHLDRFYASDTIPDQDLAVYTGAKADSLLSLSSRIEQAFRSAFAALGDSSNVIPPMSLPLEELSYSQVGASVGTKLDPSYGAYVFHEGLDFIVPRGTEVLAAAAGVVSRVENSKKFGRTVEITHAGGYKTVYAHLETVSVRRGEKVSRLEAIGTVGMTGKAFAPHLHYEVRQGEFTLDPVHYLFASVDAEEYANMLYMAVNTMQSMD